MHLLAAEAQRIDDDEAVDLDLAPAPIVILSAADGEITAFAHAAGRTAGPEVRLASLAALSHPMSVDMLADKTLRHAEVIAVRVLGGEGYFAYGIETLRRVAFATGARLIVVPGEADFDEALAARGTAPVEVARRFHAYCREGGPENRDRALATLRALVTDAPMPPTATSVPAAGLYARGRMLKDLSELAAMMPDGPAVGLVFYRSHLMDGQVGGIDALVEALAAEGLAPVPIFAASLKDEVADRVVRHLLDEAGAGVVLTTMAFSAGGAGTALDDRRRVVLEAVQASASVEVWRETSAGLAVRDLAMSVVTPEFDGRVLSRAFAFKTRGERDALTGAFPVDFVAEPGRTRFVACLAAAHATLVATPFAEKRVALVVANYPGKDGRIANGVGLDTPAATANIIAALGAAGLDVAAAPRTSAELMAHLLAGRDAPPERVSIADYRAFFAALPAEAQRAVLAEWGASEDDPSATGEGFMIPAHRFGNLVVAVQPTRAYERDPKATYHDPALVPTHAYLAFYLYLRETFGAHAVVHVGKHGNMEWLPGKGVALSETCWPEIAFGPTPHVYPFIVNDPGEGTQAKRRAQGVIVDHLTPAMTRAESHGASLELETLIDEYAGARALDPRRADRLAGDIIEIAERGGFAADLALDLGGDRDAAIAALDAHICDLKEMQIRDGLHILGESPTGRQRRDLVLAIARAPRGAGPGDASLMRAIAADFGLDFDPLDAGVAPWEGPRPAALDRLASPWRTAADTVERVEDFAAALLDGEAEAGPAARTVLDALAPIAAALDVSGEREIAAVLGALAGRYTLPGPSGAPTRGRPDILPTGRNFYAVDIRGIPTRAAWQIGTLAAERVVERYVMEEGDWPRSIVLTCWGTANMRTGGDDIAQALALVGAEPVWDGARLTGFSVRSLGDLGRPRVDVTLRVSGFFRDAFPEQIALFDAAARAVAALDEPDDQNPVAKRFREAGEGGDISVFGAMPGAYGAGLQALIDTGAWEGRTDLAEAFVAWGRYGYGKGRAGETAEHALRTRLAGIDAVVQAQDNREHDLLDSDDYYQFEGGLAAAVEAASGRAPVSLHVDTSRAERPVARTLGEEIARVVRGRAANPKWLQGVMRHGYKGAFEIAATVDYLFAFAATTNAVESHHFDQLYDAYLDDETVAAFIAEANRPALSEIAARFAEAIRRGLWSPKKNSVHQRLEALLAEDIR
ncbi:cobaltochelatase subunit CobN [Acuticoccus mangrovi]|uniref:Cobaltochelatase subunit CobN n=1 Tax=Acuticoccus mangrovi TaxID=2796142 RepID=A0A934ID57_9HYPH|nr:cobaltochelatase subunit CobN [Acuticoccus mangrovi]MBJ3774349.1 cobaltochelatase subunit CobN [Acuticoccus mangrovi]